MKVMKIFLKKKKKKNNVVVNNVNLPEYGKQKLVEYRKNNHKT